MGIKRQLHPAVAAPWAGRRRRETSKDGNFTRSRPGSPTPMACLLVVLQPALYTKFDDLPGEKELISCHGGVFCRGQFVLAVVAFLCGTGVDGGYERERELAARLVETVEQGEPVWLQASGEEFLALHYAALGALPRHALLLIHNMGGHPDWPDVISPLRTALPGQGWSTLSLQMPLLPARALADDYGSTVGDATRRIGSGIDFLRSQGYSCIVLAGYSFGASEALAYVAAHDQADGLITVGILAREHLQPVIDLPSLLAGVTVPVLDIYGRNDFPAVVDTADDRRTAMTGSDAPAYRQQVIAGADHYFGDREHQLVDVIVEWLNANFGNRACTRQNKAIDEDPDGDRNAVHSPQNESGN